MSTTQHAGLGSARTSGSGASQPDLLLERFWARRALAVLVAVTIAGLVGLLVGVVMPRGPVDSPEALLLLVFSVLGGIAAGFAMRSGWAILLAPVVNVIVFEVVRRGEQGPSVDGIHLDTTFGIIGLIVGRGVYLLGALLPMAVGAAYGNRLAVWVTTRITGFRPVRRARIVRNVVLGAVTLAVAALAVWLALPASVPPVKDANGQTIPGSIAEMTKVELGGYEQWIENRGASTENPVILHLDGGPGQSDLALFRALLEPLHQDFTVVGWDQRGAGKSYGSLDPETLTLDSVVADTIELTNYLRERFGQEKIYLLTEWWGSVPGILAVQQHPELYHAYIGSGQMVSIRETDRIIYEDLLAYAEANGDTGLANTLRGFGPPPYEDIWAYAFVAQHYELIEEDYDPPQAYTDRGNDAGVGFWGILGSEYTLIDKTNVIRGLLDMAAVMYPQLQVVDFRRDAATLEVPVYIFAGEHELRGRRELATEWFALLDAPVKQLYTFENAGHVPAFEYADDLHRILIEEIVPQTTGG